MNIPSLINIVLNQHFKYFHTKYFDQYKTIPIDIIEKICKSPYILHEYVRSDSVENLDPELIYHLLVIGRSNVSNFNTLLLLKNIFDYNRNIEKFNICRNLINNIIKSNKLTKSIIFQSSDNVHKYINIRKENTTNCLSLHNSLATIHNEIY